jgi:hypothetical protein
MKKPKKNLVLKSFFMALVGWAAVYFSTQGELRLDFAVIAVVAFTATYLGQHKIFPSNSSILGLNWNDVVCGFLIILGTLLTDLILHWTTTIPITLVFVLKTIGIALLGYISKTLASNSSGELLKGDKGEDGIVDDPPKPGNN